MPAFRAEDRRRVAAAVDEQDRLLAFLEPLLHRADESAREQRQRALLHRLDAQIDHVDVRELTRIDALLQLDETVFSRLRIEKTFERRRRRPEQADGLREFGAHHRDVAPVVARRLILLVSRLVLLIDDDEPEVLHGRENRRARADDDFGLAGRDCQPAVEPLALAEMTVPHHAAVAGRDGLEPRAQPRHRLRRERDLGHEKHHATTGLQSRVDGPQINLRLARARDAVQQRHRKFFLGEARGDLIDRDLLLGVERMRLRRDEFAGVEIVGVGDALDPLRFLARDAAFHERIRHRRGHAEAREHEAFALRAKLLLEQPVEFRLLRRAFLQLGEFVGAQPAGERELFLLLEAGAIAHRRRNHRLDDAVEPARVVAGHPPREAEQVGRQRGKRMQERRDEFQPVERKISRRAHRAHDTQPKRVAERHAHERADRDVRAQRLRHAVVQELVEARQRMDAHDHRRTVGARAGRPQPRLCSRDAAPAWLTRTALSRKSRRVSIPAAREKFQKFLTQKGLRATSQRLAIFDAAFGQHEHFTADQLLDHARTIDDSVSRATIYRTLPIMTESALLREVDIGSGEKYYRSNREGSATQVAQVVCLDCDKIFEISAPFMEWYGNTVSSKLGLTPLAQRLQVTAHCDSFRRTGTCPRRG